MKLCRWMANLFRKKDEEPTLRIVSHVGNFSVQTPAMEARRFFAPWMKQQKGPKEKRYAVCPGMFDYTQMGFILRAHTDIHIKVNKAGIAVRYGNMGILSPLEMDMLKPANFDFSLVQGMIAQPDGAPRIAQKIPLPWAVFAKEGYSCHVLPALMHAQYLDKIFVYPGIVDYDKFHTINFVFTPLKECEFTIYAGEALLHLIPFKREEYTAVSRKATEDERDAQIWGFPSRKHNYYRHNFHQKKSSRLSEGKCPFQSESEP